MFTEFAQAFQKASFFIVGHLSVHASSQNRQICGTRAEISCVDHSLGPADLLGTELGSEKRLFLEEPCTGTRLLAGLPGVLPSETIGLLEAMLPRGNDQKHYDVKGRVGARSFLAVD